MPFTLINRVVFLLARNTPQGLMLLGTTFMINRDGMFVTAAHVTNRDDQGLGIIINRQLMGRIDDYQENLESNIQFLPAKIHALDPFSDLCILSTNTKGSSNVALGSSDDVLVGDDITIFGYPHADQNRTILTYQRTSVGARILMESDGIKTKHLVLNIQSRPGQSGSPVLSGKSPYPVVAVILGSYAPKGRGGISLGGIDPQTLHQTTHAISAEYINTML